MEISERKLRMIRFAARSSSFVAPPVAGRMFVHHFTRPINPKRPPREIAWLETATREQDIIVGKGRKLPLWRWGRSGPVALLMHGWMGRGSQLAAFAEPLVKAGWQVVAFDAPAHGDADGRHSALGDFADVIAQIDQHLGGVDAIIAHSMGAAATIVACGRGLKPGKVVLVGAATRPSRFFTFFAGHLGFSGRAISHAQKRMERKYGLKLHSLNAMDIAASLDIPMLLLHDRDDRDTPHDGAVKLADAWPGSKLVSTDGLGHRRILRDDKVIAETVAFLTGKEVVVEAA